MGLNWAGLIFWCCTISSFILFIYSTLTRDALFMLISGVILIPPALYFIGSPTLWWIALLPIVHFGLATIYRRISLTQHDGKIEIKKTED